VHERSARGLNRHPLLEALSAKDRPALGRAEGYGGLLVACRADGTGFHFVIDGVVAWALPPNRAARLALQNLQRLGSFLNCLSWKNNCSPAVNTKSFPQSMQVKALSMNSIERKLLSTGSAPSTTKRRSSSLVRGWMSPRHPPSLIGIALGSALMPAGSLHG